MKLYQQKLLVICTVILLTLICSAVSSAAQSRLTDKDLEAMMQNLKNDAKSFKSKFDSAVGKSTIRKTSQEKGAKNLASTLQKQSEGLLNNFKKDKKGDGIPAIVNATDQISKLVYGLKLDAETTSSWEKVKGEVSQVANAFDVKPPQGKPELMGVSSGGSAPSCDAAVGADHSARLVQQCLQVSPATHPPCNAQNSCAMIIDEIKRGCGMLGASAPGFCSEYK